MDDKGDLISFGYNTTSTNQIETSGSNINVIGKAGVNAVFQTLFAVAIDGQPLINFLADSKVVCGLAGLGSAENKETVRFLLSEWGFSRDHIEVLSDAEMVLQLVKEKGIALIAGTGSICLGKNDGKVYRVGGLGRVLGDEGSGYLIGLTALKFGIEEEYGWGDQTQLTTSLREFYRVDELKSLIRPINLGEFSPAKIASCAPLVFELAHKGDPLATDIISWSANNVSYLIAQMAHLSQISDCEVHLWGGVFKTVYYDSFLKLILENGHVSPLKLKFVNRSRENPAVLYARQKLCGQNS